MKLTLDDLHEIRFTVVKGANAGATIPFPPKAREIRIGRAVDNDIVINDPTVSRFHARVEIAPDRCTIADAGSSAGVEKMGFRLGREAESLQSGDEFRLGDTILRFELVAKKGALKKTAAREDAQAATAAPATSPVGQALARVGLRSPAMQVAVAAALVALLAIALWPTAPGLPPQRSHEVLAVNYDATVGFLPGAESHLAGAKFTVPTDGDGLGLYFRAVSQDSIELRIGTRPLAILEPSREWRSYQLLLIPQALAADGRAEILFDNLGYDSAQGNVDPATAPGWGVSRMWLARLTTAAATPTLLSRELQSLREFHERLADDPANRYGLIRRLRVVTVGFMKIVGQPTLLVSIPEPAELERADLGGMLDQARNEFEAGRAAKCLEVLTAAIRQAEGELTREIRRHGNAFLLARKRNQRQQEIGALRAIMSLVPDATDPRHRSAVTELRKLGVAP